jgi:hypothetical protein
MQSDTQSRYEQSLAQLHERATNATGRPSTDSEASEKIDELWTEINQGLDVTNPANFGPFLTKHLSKLARETPKSERRTRLCGCGNPMCNVLSGDLPARLKQPGGRFSTSEIKPQDARAFVRQHSPCHAVQDALESWSEARSEVRQNLARIIKLGNGAASTTKINEDNIPS